MATLTPVYGTWTTITFTSVASVATSTTFVAGAECAEVDNSSNKYSDALIQGKVTVGTTPTANTQILIYGFSRLDNVVNYPDVMDGTDSVETLASVGVGAGFLRGPKVLTVDAATSNIGYPFSFWWTEIMGQSLPEFWSLFLTHNTGVNLHATGGNHVFKYQGIKYDIS